MASKTEKGSEVVRVGSAFVKLHPWKHSSGREYYRFYWHDPDTGRRRDSTRATYKEAKAAAREKAMQLSSGTIDLNELGAPQRRAICKLLAADPTLSNVDEYLVWKARKYPKKEFVSALDEYLRLTESNKGQSIQNLRTVRKNLVPLKDAFAGRLIASIAAPEINAYLVSNAKWGPRTRRNIRASMVTFWRWAQNMEWLPEGKTAAERSSRPIVKKKTPATWQAREMAIMLANVSPEYLTWLVAAAFGGFRTDEIYPLAGGTKSPLDWSDFKWERDLIEVRGETSKTGRRLVPILPALREWLWPIRKESGPLGESIYPPTKVGRGKGAIAETKRLGALVGGWKTNAIRHTWISCRAAAVGISQAAMEAGNSESETKRSYLDAKGPDEAAEWFSLTPGLVLGSI